MLAYELLLTAVSWLATFDCCQDIQTLGPQLPQANEVIKQARAISDELPKGFEKDYFSRRIIALYVRLDDMEAAYSLAGNFMSQYVGPTMDRDRQGKYHEVVSSISRWAGIASALKFVDQCPQVYRQFADHAYLHLALEAAEQRDAANAWAAYAKIEAEAHGYPWGWEIAFRLQDQERLRQFLSPYYRRLKVRLAAGVDEAGDQLREVQYVYGYLVWCGMMDEAEELLTLACRKVSEPDRVREAFQLMLTAGKKLDADEANGADRRRYPQLSEILSIHAKVEAAMDPVRKADLLVTVAEMILELDRTQP